MSRRGLGLALAAAAIVACASPDPPPQPPADSPVLGVPADSAGVLTAAREVMAEARYATLVTLGPDGHPQARIVDPFLPEEDFTVWMATNARTRKVREIAADPRVTLLYFDRDGASYVTLIGDAVAVDDPAMKAKYWKTEWAAFYPDEYRGEDYLLIRVTARRLEVSAERLGILNDPVTWRPAIVELP
jgi:PPOX class probable F420-dependent enzyme